jgi:hypothetical protein
MPNNDLEVFDHLTSNQETQLEIDYLTYALFAWKRKQWVEHFAAQHNARPTQAQIDEWIAQLPDSEYEIMRNDTARAFDDAAQVYLAEQIEEEKKAAVDNSILAEIKQFTFPSLETFWHCHYHGYCCPSFLRRIDLPLYAV